MVELVTSADVSIVMPIRNGVSFAPASLDRLTMMAGNAEVIIIDDGSTDGTFEYCKSIFEENENFIVLKSPGSGIAQALNYGIAQARGTWIARFDIDDEYATHRLLEQIEIANRMKSILIFSDYSFYANGVVKMGTIPSAIFSNPVKLSLISGRRTPHPTAFFRKDMYKKAGGYRSEDSPAEDLSLWLRMHSLGEFSTSDSDLLLYRLARTSVTMQYRSLSIKRRRQLLLKYPLDASVFKASIDNLKYTLKAYSDFAASEERIILHLLDIYLYSRLYKSRLPFKTKLVYINTFLKLRYLTAGSRLLLSAFRRYNFRRAQKGTNSSDGKLKE